MAITQMVLGNNWRQRLELQLFYLPLAMPQILMSIVHGFIMASLARLEDAATVIAAFTLGSGVAFVMEAAIVPGRPLAMTLVRDQRSWRVVRNTVWLSGLILVTLLTPLTYGTPLARLTMQGIFGVPDALLTPTMISYSVLMTLAPVGVLRFVYYGVLIGQRRPIFITFALMARMVLTVSLAYLAVNRGWFQPLLVGPILLMVGITFESVLVYLAARRIVNRLPEVAPDHPPIMASEVLRLMVPLSGALMVFTFARPAINAAIGGSVHAPEALAAIGLSNLITFTTMVLLASMNQLAAVFGTDLAGRARVMRFAIGLGLLVTVVLAWLGFSTTGSNLIEGLLGVPVGLHVPFITTIRALTAWPLLFSLSDYTQGILLIERRTRLIGAARTVGVLSSIGLMYLLVGYGKSPAQLTGMAIAVLVIGTAVELAIMATGRRLAELKGLHSVRTAQV